MQFEIIRKSLPRSKAIRGPGSSHEQTPLTGSLFLYVGSNRDLLRKLTTVFDFGYSAENLRLAMQALQQLQNHDASVVQTIILDTDLDLAELEELRAILAGSNGLFLSVPVLYNVNKLNANEKNLLRRSKVVDDLIDLEGNYSTINERAVFLRKIKESICILPDTISVESNGIEFGLASFVKRGLDVLISLFLIILLTPVFLVIATIIKLESNGPVFYNAYRAGRGYKIFKFFRFRTMRVGADRIANSLARINRNARPGILFKSNRDRRFTRSGSFLQKLRLDELPQLFNVLKGDMSIVGNKPLPLHEASTMTTDEWAERFIAPAGVTGLWKIRSAAYNNLSFEERLQLDIDYARKHSLMMDFAIMLQTTKGLFL